ncbi:MAG: alanine--tRNA ligase [Candidatus Omnitrophota bacterium]
MKTDQIRESFLAYFESRGHKRVASDSLVPQNDPTLLFTGAGMNQFKEYFLGLKKDMTRATSSQKCLRTGDLENVGRTAYHHSFFEMLGNFSFGDYFKREAIEWAWEYLTRVLKIPVERLRISVHTTDAEAKEIWRSHIGIREDWIYALGDDSNFWPANAPQDGPNGPCGPCSEIYYDMDPASRDEEIGSKRFAEIWNLVFTQYDRQDTGRLQPLANKNIDTGMGLERLAAVLQGKTNNFDVDIFQPIRKKVVESLNLSPQAAGTASVNAISDHARAIAFAMADGAIPSNEGRGYVIRKLIRRALWHAWNLCASKRLEGPFLFNVIPEVAEVMNKPYPELRSALASIRPGLRAEEERFLETLGTGLKILETKLKKLEKGAQKMVPGETVFELYDTYGFPDELTERIAAERGFGIDAGGFESLMEKQRVRAKEASQIAGAIFVTTDLEQKIAGLPATRFTGYDASEGEGTVLFVQEQRGQGVLVLDQTPFYAESGGQVGDHGTILAPGVLLRVIDVQKKDKTFLHYFHVEKGKVQAGDKVRSEVDCERRDEIMRHHTATHLLHAALREILGDSVRQMGSLVAADRLRFDYSYPKALGPEILEKIEDRVNQEILSGKAVSKEEKPILEAQKEGAIAFFGEKYGERVRVVSVPGYSKEFCGGIHCEQTSQIGVFMIVSESAVGSGVRRIEAVAGRAALHAMRRQRTLLTGLAQELRVPAEQLAERIRRIKESVKQMEKERIKSVPAGGDLKTVLAGAVAAGGYQWIAYRAEGLDVTALRALSDAIRKAAKKAVYFLGTWGGEKIQFVVGLSDDLREGSLDVRDLTQALSPILGSSGGGRKDWVQGGGRQEGQFEARWEEIDRTGRNYLEKQG